MVHARKHGVPVPEVFDAQGPDLLLERVDGPTMADSLARRPWALASYAQQLADVHAAVHRAPGLDWLAHPFGPGESLLHLDLHPQNVLVQGDTAVVIDWPNAATGPAEADLADTWLVVSAARLPRGRVIRGLAAAVQSRFARHFLVAAGAPRLEDVLEAVATRRLHDKNMRSAERERIQRLVTVRRQ